ncbi:WavE lipopolysaccharide synthesis family protein [Moraxella nasibovis]|uniref:WavE lipopolysaccharide synthesis family protein n=1 Tax=Moraxella nasibovis TaxID=2904120 RepID=UPI00241028EB|nr:WavE lipopolysaccharide synthesis family protein [Moraxella nasibovis]WFF38740.1 WavE lipopolysaccharide synthesis family protein [Moraxella nasibovis]
MINDKDITVIYQGAVNVSNLGTGNSDSSDFLYNVQKTRTALPNATIILSTWSNTVLPSDYDTPEKLGVDKIVYSDDPGALPNIKFDNLPANNANRQLLSTLTGLKATTTRFAMKLRTDSFLTGTGFKKAYSQFEQQVSATKKGRDFQYSPIVLCCYFTIDPNVYEHMAFHMSDWVHFGETKTLLKYWDVPFFNFEDATFYERHPHDKSSNFFDRQFRTRIAVEQYLTTEFAKKFGYAVPVFHNQIDKKILFDFDKFLAERMIVLDLDQFGVDLPKYKWVRNSDFISMDILMHADWYGRFVAHWQPKAVDKQVYALFKKRQHQKVASKWVAKVTGSFAGYWWHSPENKKRKRFVEKAIKFIP